MVGFKMMVLGLAILSYASAASLDMHEQKTLLRIRRQDSTLQQTLQGLQGQRRPGQSGNLGNGQNQGFGNQGQGPNQNFGSNQGQGFGNRPNQGLGFGSQGQGSNGFGNQGSNGFGNQGSNGFGNQGQGSNGFGSQGSNGFGNQGQGSNGFGNQGSTGFGNQGQGSNGFGNQGQGSNGFSNNQGGSNGGNQGGQFGWTTQRPPFNIISNENSIDAQTTACIRNCGVVNNYNPVCGNDNITYQNPQKLQCAQQQCNRQVQIAYNGACVTTRAPNRR